jgi:tetratricopeptide (TPR) repeat protein
MGDRERATTLAQAALEAATSIGDVTDQLSAHNLLGVIATGRSDTAAAARHLEEAVRLAESVGKSELANTSRLNLGVAYLEAGRIDDARERFQTVLDDRIHEGLSEGVGFARLNLGETEYAAGDLDAAEVHFTIAVDAFRAVGFKVRHANALQGLAAVEARTGRAEAAAERLGVAATLMTDTGWGADGGELAPVAEAAAREALGDVAFERFFRAGADPGLA